MLPINRASFYTNRRSLCGLARRSPGNLHSKVTTTDMRLEDVHELRRALERLFEQLYEATHALNRLNARVNMPLGTYRAHGAPFGRSRAAVRIWRTYRQYTTQN